MTIITHRIDVPKSMADTIQDRVRPLVSAALRHDGLRGLEGAVLSAYLQGFHDGHAAKENT